MNLVKNLDDFIKDFTEYKIKMDDKLNNLENENNQLKERLSIVEIESNKLKIVIENNILNKNENCFSSGLKRNRNLKNKEISIKKNKSDNNENYIGIGINETRDDKKTQDNSFTCWCNPNSTNSTSIVSSPTKYPH